MTIRNNAIPQFTPGEPLKDVLSASRLNAILAQINALSQLVTDMLGGAPIASGGAVSGFRLGLITSAGPNGEADDDSANGYWVKMGQPDPSLETGDAVTLVEEDAPNVAEIVAATNLAEATDSHALAINNSQPVQLWRVVYPGGVPQEHWVFFHSPGGGGGSRLLLKITDTLSGDGRYKCKLVTAPTTDRTATGTLGVSDFGTLDSVESWAFNLLEIGRTGHALDPSLLTDVYFDADLLYTNDDGTKVYRFWGVQPEDCDQEA